MNSRELFVSILGKEIPAFERVLGAVPTDKIEWRPHDGSRSAIELGNAIASGSASMAILARDHKVDLAETESSKLGSLGECSRAFVESAKNTLDTASKATDSEWDDMTVFMIYEGGKWEDRMGAMLWGFLLDLIHHRGQLSVYIRPMGGRVPSIYGPSKDDPGK